MIDVSVIVPVYNVEAYIRPFLDSLLAQTHKNFEAILVDDGSPDASGAICDEYAARDARLRVIHKQNGGVGRARNTGLDEAQGEYVYICDPDDLLDARLLEDNLRIARDEDADIVTFGFKRKTENDEKIRLPKLSGTYTYKGFWDRFQRAEFATSVCVNLYRRSFLEKNRLRFNTWRTEEDACFTYDTFAAPFGRIAFNRYVYYTYRIRPKSATTGYVPEHLENRYLASRRYGEMLSTVPQAGGRYQHLIDLRYLAFCRVAFKMQALSQTPSYAQRRRMAVGYARRPEIREAIRRGWKLPSWSPSHKWINLLLRLHLYDAVLLIYRVRGNDGEQQINL